MGHDKLRKFAENETFACLLQPSSEELLADGYFNLHPHPVKGHWADFFHNDKPIVLELGCGKGEYTIDLAQRNPDCNYIGVDIKGARLWKGAKYATEHSLANVAFLRTRIEFIEAFFAPGEIDQIWLTFSDPQHKRENARLSAPVFLERYLKFVKPGGVIHLKTDSRFLHEYTKAVCTVNGLKILACSEDLYGAGTSSDSPSVCTSDSAGAIPPEVTAVQTFYEKMFLAQGYKINYLAFALDRPVSPAGVFASTALDSTFAHPRDPEDFDSEFWRTREGYRTLFGRDTAETRRQKLHSAEPSH